MSSARPTIGINSTIHDRIQDIEIAAPTVGTVMTVGLADVAVHSQVRHSIDTAKLDELAEAIRVEGQRQPVEVSFEKGRYVLVTGERRYQALSNLGWSGIEVKIVKKPAKSELIYLQVTENEKREALDAIDLALAIKDLSDTGEDNASIATRLGMSVSAVGRYKAIGKGGKSIHDAYYRGVKDLRTLQLLAQIELRWPSALDDLLEQVVAGKLMRDELETWVKHLKAKGVVPKKDAAPGTTDSLDTTTGDANAEVPSKMNADAAMSGVDGTANPQLATDSKALAGVSPDTDHELLPRESDAGISAGERVEQGAEHSGPTAAAIAATPIDAHYSPTHEAITPEKISIMVKGKLANGEVIKGTLMLDRVDQDASWVWVQPDNSEKPPVKLEAKKLKIMSVT